MDISTTTIKEREEVKKQILSNAWCFYIYSVTVSLTGGHMAIWISDVLWDSSQLEEQSPKLTLLKGFRHAKTI